MKKIFLILFLFCSFFVFSPAKSYADQNFATSFDVTYTVSEDGLTHVMFKGSLQNITDKFYATFYTLRTGFEDIQHLTASDSKGTIKVQMEKKDTGENITFPFNTKALGINKKISFTASFDTTDIAKHVGSVWEINIPGIANQADFKEFTVHVRVPTSFGKPAYSKPQQGTLDFDKGSLGGAGISLAFGENQVYDFTLNYHLKNDNLFPITTEIALPPSTNYQEVVMHDISPKPANVSLDTDGNWLAKFYLLPSQKVAITAKGTAYISLTPKKEQLSSEEKKLYEEQQPYWQTGNSDIKKLAMDLKTPQNIFDYVVHHLSYDFTRVAGKQERVGAENVLKHPTSAVCLEFTDLFITLARAAGIPAREIDGFAYTQNKQQRPLSLVKDVLHAWPEYYDSQQQAWIMVDPTWSNTTKGTDYFHTLDFDHVAFIIRGEKSTYPIPPGGYKLSSDDKSKDVFVSFGNNEKLQAPQITVSFDIAPNLFAGIPITGNLVFKNASDRMVTLQKVDISTPFLFPRTQSLLASAIPPFGYAQLPVKFHSTSFLTSGKETITIKVAGNTLIKTVTVSSFILQNKYVILGACIVLFLVFVFLLQKILIHHTKR